MCTQAPFGKNERTIVDKSVRDTWELDSSKVSLQALFFSTVTIWLKIPDPQVHFGNSEWTKWMTATIVPAVQESLGVASTPAEARPYKLLVYETGSQYV